MYIPYSGKVWRAECLANVLLSSVWRKKIWRMNRSAKGLSMVTTTVRGKILEGEINGSNVFGKEKFGESVGSILKILTFFYKYW